MTLPPLAGLRSSSRLAALRDTELLDTPPEEQFDRLTKIAAAATGAPIAMLTLLDREREFVMSSTGLAEPWASRREMPLSHSFCKHLLDGREALVIADAAAEALVRESPAVSEVGFAAYAGVAIRCRGEVLGGFCVVDAQPHAWRPEDVDVLTGLAGAVTRDLEVRSALRRSRAELARVARPSGAGTATARKDDAEPLGTPSLFRSLVENSLAGIYLVQDHRFRYVNRRLAEIFGYAPTELVGTLPALDLVSPADRPRVAATIRRWLGGDADSVRYAFDGVRRDGSRVFVEVHGTRTEVAGSPAIIGTVLDRTEERRGEDRLRRSEEHFRSLIENAWDVVYLVDEHGAIRYASPSVERVLGHTPAELTGKRALGLVHPGDAPRAEGWLAEALSRPGTQQRLELRLVRSDGDTRVVEAVAKAVSVHGAAPEIVVNLHDVSNAKQAEESLRASEERYRLVSQATTDLILDWDVASGALLWDGAGPQMFRYTPEEAGDTVSWFYERIHPEDRERVVREQEAVLNGMAAHWSGEYRFRRGDGRYAAVLHRGHVLRDARGDPLRMIGSVMDVTERRHGEEAQRFLARASALLDSSLDYEATLASLARLTVPTLADYCLVDLVQPDGTVQRVGAAHADPSRERLLVRNESVKLDDDPERHPVLRAIRTGEPVFVSEIDDAVLDRIGHDPEHRRRLEAVGLRAFMVVPLRGHDRVLGAITLAVSDAGRRYQHADLVVAEDLARRAAVGIEHALLYQEVRQAVRDREEVLGFVTHDLRNPLHTIYIAASLLLESLGERRTEHRKWIETIRSASDQMNGLIDDLFDVSRMGAGRFSLDPAPQAVDEVLGAACELLRPLAESAGVAIACRVREDLPPVWADRDQVLRVLSNLVGNAIKFTPEGGTITLAAVADDGEAAEEVVFSVRDAGPGIDADELPHVFDRYWQGHRGDRRGAGMGLAIARGVVEAHGGRIWVESPPGEGAAFHFSLPVERRGGAGGESTT